MPAQRVLRTSIRCCRVEEKLPPSPALQHRSNLGEAPTAEYQSTGEAFWAKEDESAWVDLSGICEALAIAAVLTATSLMENPTAEPFHFDLSQAETKLIEDHFLSQRAVMIGILLALNGLYMSMCLAQPLGKLQWAAHGGQLGYDILSGFRGRHFAWTMHCQDKKLPLTKPSYASPS